MNRVVRAILVWVMVIAMPVQAMAASLMLFCGPSHARMVQGLVDDAPAARPAHAGEAAHDHAHAGHAVPHHAAQDDRGAAQPAVEAEADNAGSLRGQHGKASCSACAACCSALALPASFSLPEAVRVAHPMQASSSAPVASHQTDGPDRPPRADLA